ncbi:Hint domain-containing protein, partial [Acetobacter orleanensis]|uniref:Hint domain-containing protein n=1 Tax=Acetobacter orleanensis TaxID=104099 RepID=UPI000AE119D8
TTVNGGALNLVEGAVVSNTTVAGSGSFTVASGTTARNTTVNAGGLATVSGGTLTTATVSGGEVDVFSGGTVSAANVTNGGNLYVEDGASAVSASVGSAGYLEVDAGGVASGTQVGSAGIVQLAGTGVASGTTLGSSATLYAGSGTTAVGTVVQDGASLQVQQGGVASGTLQQGGTTTIFAGASATDTTVNGGALNLVEGAVVSNTVVNRGGKLDVEAGSTASGVTVASGGEADVSGNLSNATVESGGALVVTSTATISGVVVSNGGNVQVQSGGSLTNVHVSRGGGIDLGWLAYDSGITATVVDGHTLEISGAGSSKPVATLEGDYTNDFFVLSDDGHGGTLLTLEEGTPCYCPGTAILTETGERPVEELEIGDRLVTRNGTLRPIRWIGRRAYDGRFAAGRTDIMPVRIAAGALGNGLPQRDLVISPLHAMFLLDVLVPAQALVNGETITQQDNVSVIEYIHIELETHDIIFAEGALSETFVDDGSRGMFHNAHEFAELYPDIQHEEARYCAPRVEDGEALEIVRRYLASVEHPAVTTAELYIDSVTRSRIAGWGWDPKQPDGKLRLKICAGGVVLCHAVADQYRGDLKATGKGNGFYAFEVDLVGGLTDEQIANLSVSVVGVVPAARAVA